MTGKEKCLAKIGYISERSAWTNALYFYRIFGSKSDVYKCIYCPKWHLTSKTEEMIIPEHVKVRPSIQKELKKLDIVEKSIFLRIKRFVNGKLRTNL